MAMTPMIVIGCGGSGGKVIASLRRTLSVNLLAQGWEEGIPDAWQLLYVDTPSSQELDLTYGPLVPARDYISVSEGESVYRRVDSAVMRTGGAEGVRRFVGWRPSPSITIPVDRGAGQWRALGRVAAFNGLPAVGRRIKAAIGEISGGASQLERLGRLVGDDSPAETIPFVVVVSSLAGGTGAGIFLDVADVVRSVQPRLQSRIAGILFTAEVFRDLNNVPGVQPNTLAALSELMAGYFDADRSLEPLIRTLVSTESEVLSRSGVNYPFVVGMSTLAGNQLTSIPDAYRAVTETLAAALLNPAVAQPLLNQQVANWPVEQQNHATAWRFGNAPRADGLGGDSGVVSSFGSARLSVGVARFSDYAAHRLARAVVEYLADGYIGYGRERLNDPQASPQQIIDYLVTENALKFVEDSGLRELNDPVGGEHNQVLDAIIPNAALVADWKAWWQGVHRDLMGQPPQTSATWITKINAVVPTVEGSFLSKIRAQCDSGQQQLMRTLPQRTLAEVSNAIGQYGVPVTIALVRYAHDHVSAAIKQLKEEAANERTNGAAWMNQAGEALLGIKPGLNLPPTHEDVAAAVRGACGGAYREARAHARDTATQFLQRFIDQVLVRLEAMLDQVRGQLAGNEATDLVSSWPASAGVPAMFAPPPLEFCLVDPATWPTLYRERLSATASDERGQSGTSDEIARRLVGGGGFAVERDGVQRTVPRALELEEPWSGGPVRFTTHFAVSDIEERARLWLGRKGTPFGDFLGQRLGGYLSGSDGSGRPVADLAQRLDRFKDGLQRTLSSATPLIAVDPAVLRSIHPNTTFAHGKMTKLIAERLPLTGGAARAIAEQALEPYRAEAAPIDEFFGDGTHDVEGVLYVSRLAGAVHPSAVTSLVAPIAASWNRIRGREDAIGPFWQNRRARLLAEFVPLSPTALDALIVGWFTSRLLGICSAPDPNSGFKVAYVDGNSVKEVGFPWPLLRCGAQANLTDTSLRMEWLPALLESIGLAFALVPSEPNILRGYDELYVLGRSTVLANWIKTGESKASKFKLQVSGADVVDRRASVTKQLQTLQNMYRAEVDNRRVVVDEAEFYALPFGFDLYDRFAQVLGTMVQAISSISDSEDGPG